MDFLTYLEQTGFSIWVRESRSLFSYPGILLLHTYGMAIVVGLIAGIDLRILGFAPALPLAPMRKLLPIMWAAFWVNAVTGTILMVVDATTKLRNPDFFIKMGLILVAVVIQRLIEKRVFRDGQADAPLTDERQDAGVHVARLLARGDYGGPAARVCRTGQRVVGNVQA